MKPAVVLLAALAALVATAVAIVNAADRRLV